MQTHDSEDRGTVQARLRGRTVEWTRVRQLDLTCRTAAWEATIMPSCRGRSLRRADADLDQVLRAALEEDWHDRLVPRTARVD